MRWQIIPIFILACSCAFGMPTIEGTSTAGTYSYTAGEAHTIDSIAIHWASAASNTVTVSIVTVSGTVTTVIVSQQDDSLSDFLWMPDGGQLTINPTNQLTITDTQGGTFYVTFSRSRVGE